MQDLHRRAKEVLDCREILEVFLGRYAKFVSFSSVGEPARARRPA
jgi:hypothetical protein